MVDKVYGSDLDTISENNEYFNDIDESFINYLKSRGIFRRVSMDAGNSNSYGTELLNLCRTCKLVICNGRLHSAVWRAGAWNVSRLF